MLTVLFLLFLRVAVCIFSVPKFFVNIFIEPAPEPAPPVPTPPFPCIDEPVEPFELIVPKLLNVPAYRINNPPVPFSALVLTEKLFPPVVWLVPPIFPAPPPPPFEYPFL